MADVPASWDIINLAFGEPTSVTSGDIRFRQCPVADIHLLLEHGLPKSVRLFPGGHMGLTPQTLPTIVEWLAKQVRGEGVRS